MKKSLLQEARRQFAIEGNKALAKKYSKSQRRAWALKASKAASRIRNSKKK